MTINTMNEPHCYRKVHDSPPLWLQVRPIAGMNEELKKIVGIMDARALIHDCVFLTQVRVYKDGKYPILGYIINADKLIIDLSYMELQSRSERYRLISDDIGGALCMMQGIISGTTFYNDREKGYLSGSRISTIDMHEFAFRYANEIYTREKYHND